MNDDERTGQSDSRPYHPSAALLRGCQVLLETPRDELEATDTPMDDAEAMAMMAALERGEY